MAYKTYNPWFKYKSRTHSYSTPFCSLVDFYKPTTAASISLNTCSLVKCFREIAPVGHNALHRPHPLHRTGLTVAFLPCRVSLNSMAPYSQASIHAPHPMHVFLSTSQTEPETATISCERRTAARPAAP